MELFKKSQREDSYNRKKYIVEWLEIEPSDNFKLTTRNASETQKTVLTGAKRTKAQGYAELAAYVNAKTGSNWTQSDAMSRFRSLETTYKNTKRRYANVNGEKYTLTSEDLAKGIKTIDDKLENVCPFYHRLDKLYRDKEDIISFYTCETGMECPKLVFYSVSKQTVVSQNTVKENIIPISTNIPSSLSSNSSNVSFQPIIPPPKSSSSITADKATNSSKIQFKTMEKKDQKRLFNYDSSISTTDCDEDDLDGDPKRKKDRKSSDMINSFNYDVRREEMVQLEKLKIERDKMKVEERKFKYNAKMSLIQFLFGQGKTTKEVKEIIKDLYGSDSLN